LKYRPNSHGFNKLVIKSKNAYKDKKKKFLNFWYLKKC
jgi:hypothetical protein